MPRYASLLNINPSDFSPFSFFHFQSCLAWQTQAVAGRMDYWLFSVHSLNCFCQVKRWSVLRNRRRTKKPHSNQNQPTFTILNSYFKPNKYLTYPTRNLTVPYQKTQWRIQQRKVCMCFFVLKSIQLSTTHTKHRERIKRAFLLLLKK